jgi:hypothetical protein
VWCEGNGLPCHQEALIDPPLCSYHYKLSVGLLADSHGRYHAAPADRPKFIERDPDGWLTLASPEPDLIDQMLGWDEKRLRALEGFR